MPDADNFDPLSANAITDQLFSDNELPRSRKFSWPSHVGVIRQHLD
jgi:hypothetical protein